MFTALLIALLIVAGAGSALVGGWLLESQRRRALERGPGAGATPGRALPDGGSAGVRLLERGLGDPRPGDVVQYDGRDWLVEGVLLYDEDGHRWAAGRLVDVEAVRWMVVGLERAGGAGPLLLADDRDIDVGGYPPEVLVADDKRYQLERRGTATVKALGDTGALPAARGLSPESVLRCRWWRYQAAGRDCIVVEQWGRDFRVLRGTAVPDGQLELIPGS